MNTIQERIKEACEMSGTATYRSYSGRGMYGKTCVGIVGSFRDCMNIIAIVVGTQAEELYDANDDDASDIHYDLQDNLASLMEFNYDSMGLDVVVYWPKIEYIRFDDQSDEEDEG